MILTNIEKAWGDEYKDEVKIIFMGTPEFAVPSLTRLLDDGHEISCVFTQPDKPAGRGNHLQSPAVKLLAVEHRLTVHQPGRIKNNDDVRSIFNNASPDACVVAAYGRILPEWLLRIPRLGCINVHSSLLPKYRGAAPINWSIANGEEQTGVTIMLMDAGMDTGPILAQRAVGIRPDETAPELSKKLAGLGANLLGETLPRFGRGEIQPISQNADQASYAPILKREHGLIDWKLTAQQIANRVRGFVPWPGTYTNFRRQRLIFWSAKVADGNDKAAAPSTILKTDALGITLGCSERTALLVLEVQIEGKRRISARDFANGMHLKAGERICEDSG